MRFHDELNPVIWDKDNDNQMRPEVLAKLKEIANAFIEYIEIPEDAILDMVVTGSSASYNYNEFSDLDLHIIVDYDKIHEDCPLVEGYLGALKNTFNKEHDITIHDVPVELYAEAKDQGTVHNGLYSVQNEEWIDRPKKIPPTDNDAAVEAKYYEIKDMVDKCDDSETATELLEKIYTMRKAGLATAGEFCTENLAFKKLRNEGCMDKLREIKKKDIDKQLSLESYNENVDDIVVDNYLKMLLDNGHVVDTPDSQYIVQVFTNKELQRLIEFDDIRKASKKFIELTDIYTKDEDVVLFKQLRDNGKDIKTIDSTWLNVKNKNESVNEEEREFSTVTDFNSAEEFKQDLEKYRKEFEVVDQIEGKDLLHLVYDNGKHIATFNNTKLQKYSELVNEEKEMNEDNKFDYMMLDRLRQDCEYFLGNGNGSEKNLWAGNVEDQIAEMRKIYDKLPEKPEWLSLEDIDKYEKDMLALKEQPMEEDLATLEKKMDNVDADIQDMINQLKDTTNEELITNLDTVIKKALDEDVNDLDNLWGVEMFINEEDPETNLVEYTKKDLIRYIENEYSTEIPMDTTDDELKEICDSYDMEVKYIK